MSIQADLVALFDRELDELAREVGSYEDEGDLWSTRGAQKNPPGSLAWHIGGNLLHYVGAELGGTGYVRDRPGEFSDRVSRDELLARIAEARRTVAEVLATVPDEVMAQEYPGALPGPMAGMTTRRFLLHLLWHLGWHRGQIYYHRLGGDG